MDIMSDRAGEIIREYQLLRKVGEGEFASVYEALEIHLNRTIAIKIIHPRHMTQHDSMMRFKSEASMIAHLNHPHIVRLYTFWIDDDGAYIAIQWMPGGSLDALLAKKGKLPLSQVNNILQKITPALSAVHRQQIVHRDLKPANIMLDDNENPYVADFGLAKWHTQPTGVLISNASIGTPAYMPPEQVEASDITISGAADTYSLGVIIYELLTGHHPFYDAKGVVEMILHQLRDPIPSIRETLPEIPEAIDHIIQKATQKNPADRYGDILELADAFQNALSLPRQPSLTTRTLAEVSGEVAPRGDVYAHVYTRSGTVLAKPRRLIGREKIVEIVLDALYSAERILLHGLAGMGKTSTAATIASQYLDGDGEKVIWIELGKQTADTFFDAIANALGQSAFIAGKTGDQRILALRELLLEQEKTLLVIDNIWNEPAMIPIMRSIPHEIPVLLTSRKLLSIDGILMEVEQLDDRDALDLLQFHANQKFEHVKLANRLLAMLGNHPYAIELAGSRLKIYRHITLEKLIQDISETPHDTGQLGQVKKRGITELLDESMRELSEPLRELLVMMGGLYTTYASLELLSYIVGQDLETLTESLAELERNGLIRLNTDNTDLPYYRMHDLTYSYLYVEFSEALHHEMILTGIGNYVNIKSTIHDALAFDLVHILGGIRQLHRSGNHNIALNLIGKLMTDGYVDSRGYSPQILEQMNQSIQAGMDSPTDYQEVLHYLLTKRGNALDESGDLLSAQADYEHALQFAPNDHRRAIMLCVLGGILFRQQNETYVEFLEEAYQIGLHTDDDIILQRVLESQGMCAEALGQYDISEKYLTQAVEIAKKIENIERIVAAQYNLATLKATLGKNQESLVLHQMNYEQGEKTGNFYWIALSMSGMGLAYHGLGDRISAEKYFRDALELYKKLGDAVRVAWVQEFTHKHQYFL